MSFPVIETFEADRMEIDAGETVTLTYKVTKAQTVGIDPVLQPSSKLEGTVETPPLTQSLSFTLRALSRAGETTKTLAITVRSPQAVQIVDFDATPKTIMPGMTATLSWHTLGATRVQLAEKNGAVLEAMAANDGTHDVMPSVTTTYVLFAEGMGGPTSMEVVVLVGLNPVIDRFEAHPSQIAPGGSATLEWSTQNASSVLIRNSSGTIVVANAPAAGSQVVMPAMTTEYQLVVSSPTGDLVQSATVQVVTAGAPRILEFTATPDNLPAAGPVDLVWNVVDADTVDMTVNGMPFSVFPRTPMGMLTVNFPRSGLLLLRAENMLGVTTAMVMVTIGAVDSNPPVIMHTPIMGGQPQNQDVPVAATITDMGGGTVASATLFYRTVGAMTFDSAPMMDAGNDRYSANIPAATVVAPGVEYYIHATDNAGTPNVSTDPMSAPGAVHMFDVTVPDTAAPVITHTPITADQAQSTMVTISANITDASPLGAVTLYYKGRADAMYTPLAMTMSGSDYTAIIPAAIVVAPGVDYYLEASDTAAPANTAVVPATAPATPYSFTVIAPDTTAPAIVHTRIANGQPTGTAITVNADITDASGVSSATLFYRAQGTTTYTQIAMTGAGSAKSATIPGSAVNPPGIDYYLEASDTAVPANIAHNPTTAPGTPINFTIATADTAAPTIAHTPISDGRTPNTAVAISATVNDSTGVASVTLFYRTQGVATYSSVAMTGGPTYTANIPAATVIAPGVEYYIRAVDTAPGANSAVLPATAPGAGYAFRTGSAEAEPNGTTAQATLLLGPGLFDNIGLGAITPVADRDHWYIDVPAGATRYNVRLEVTSGGVATCPAPTETSLTLYGTNGTTVLVSDTFDGVGSCSLIDAAIDSGARALAAGRYFVRIQENGDNAAITAYELRGTMSAAVCGNGILESAIGEQCDDGSTAAGDGCSATCQIEPEGTASGTGGVFAGDISPAGDSDLFSVVIGSGQFLRAEVSNGSGGCPGNTVLELYGTDGITSIGSDDDDGIGSCSLIDPAIDTWAANMTAGTYFLRVRAFAAGTVINGYSLDVRITSNICGNGAVESGEQCDDGNSTSFDGCSGACQWEIGGTAMGMGGSFSGGITPVGNVDFYAVVVPAGASLYLETFAPTDGMCSSGNDTVIRLFASDRTTEIISDDEGGIASCSKLDPSVDPEVRSLAAGTYYVSVEDWLNDDEIAAYVLDIEIRVAACGDGFVSGTEQCDDGNTTGSDGCSATCALEGTAEVEPNDTRANATPHVESGVADATINGALQSTTDVDTYRVVIANTSQLLAEITNGREGCNAAMTLRLLSSTGTQLLTDSTDGPGSCGRLSPGGDPGARNLAAGTYYLEVSGTAGGTYQLHTRVMAPGCGDTYMVTGEQCDDGNTVAGDGCSATCQFETMETEPNDTYMMAMDLTGGALKTVNGGITTAGEQDWYRVTVPANASIHVAVHNGGIDQCGSMDPDLEVFGPNSGTTSIISDDLDGQGYCPIIYRNELFNLAAGTYYILVDGYDAADTFDYVLTLQVW